ncbi:AAA family ATPase [Nonomuraea lactucae]|uniref:AAA family ATPase n=1 Tax=Nonomuraea lactucae TaxID=2249762 RepID=UPI0013B47229|nr:AAA family ATPase [Nonomuraea lactucae]
MGRRVQAARDCAFVGRAEELELFRSALRGDPSAGAVLYLHGPGGVGKSMLLRRLAAEAEAAGRVVVEIDGRMVDPTPVAFEAQAHPAPAQERVVLVIDSFERCQGLEGWLRERFLPRMAAGAIVVIAGREPPDDNWTSDPGWAGLLQVAPLREFAPLEAVALLQARGVPAAVHEAVLAFTGGNPLALTLAAAVTVDHATAAAAWTPSHDVVQTLLRQLVGEVPSAMHQRALQVCAHVRVTSEALLRAVLGEDGWRLFDWLRCLPFMESSGQGVFPHDAVRESLEADLRWRDADGYEALHRRLHLHFLQRVRAAPEAEISAAVGELLYVHRADGYNSEVHTWQGGGEVHEDVLEAADHAVVLRLVAEAEGEASARIARYWLDRQPEAFRVYRSTQSGQIIACFAWLRCEDPTGEEVDPVVSAAWAHARTTAPLQAGRYLAVERFAVHPARYQRPSPVMDLMQWRILGEIFRSEQLSWSFFVKRDDGFWNRHLVDVDIPPIAARPHVGPHSYALFAHDWHANPPVAWAELRMRRMFAESQARAEFSVLSRPEFDAAVRDALRAVRQPHGLDRNPLRGSRFVGERDLAEVLASAVEDLLAERGGEKYHRAVRATYWSGAPTQEAAAARLGLPFSTYRRHLTRGVERLCEVLWRRELYGG